MLTQERVRWRGPVDDKGIQLKQTGLINQDRPACVRCYRSERSAEVLETSQVTCEKEEGRGRKIVV